MRTVEISNLIAMRRHYRRAATVAGCQVAAFVGVYLSQSSLNDIVYPAGAVLALLACIALVAGRTLAARISTLTLLIWDVVLTVQFLSIPHAPPPSPTVKMILAAPFVGSALYVAVVPLLPTVRAAARSPYVNLVFATEHTLAAYASGTVSWKNRMRQLRAMPILVGVLTFAVAILAAVLLRSKAKLKPTSAGQKVARDAVFGAGGALFVWTKRRFALRGAEIRGIDHRPPVLLLRSFGDDMMVIRRGARSSTLSNLARRGMTFERMVSDQLAPFGPVVAIGRPEEPLAPLGAARDYVADEVWQVEVQHRIQDSAVVVLIIATSEGLAWELLRMRDLRQLHKLVLLFPPADDVVARWDTLLRRDRATASPVLPEAIRPEQTLALIYADDLTPVAIEGGRDEWSYETAVRIAGMLAVTTGADPAPA